MHQTQAGALTAARTLVQRTGGGEVVTHAADGRFRSSDVVGPAKRAARSEGPRTTLRLPSDLAAVADLLAADLEISRNDALLRLASRGARIYEQERAIEERREARWAAVLPGVTPRDDELPTPSEARDAVLDAREQPSAA